MSTKQFKFSVSAPSAPYYCGIDVHKHEIAVCVYCSGETQSEFTKHSVFGTDSKSLDAFWNFTRKYHPVGYVMEATNIYHHIIYHLLQKKRNQCNWPFQIMIVNPADASGIPNRQKFDKIDAENLARYLAKDLLKPCKPLIEALEDMKAIFRTANRVERDRTALKNRIKKTLSQAGIRPLGMNLNYDWVLDLLRCFIKYNGSLGEYLTEALKKGHPMEKHHTMLNKNIKKWTPYGTFTLTHPKKCLIRQFLGDLDFKTARKALLALEVDMVISHEPGLRQMAYNLSTIPGISKFSAVWILVEIGNIKQFSNMRKFLSFCGCCPLVKKSANKVYSAHVNRHSNKYLRKIFFIAGRTVCNLTKKPSALRDYAKYIKEKKGYTPGKKLAYSIVAAKIASIVYVVLTQGVPFKPYPTDTKKNYSSQNREDLFNVCEKKSIRRARNCLLRVNEIKGIGSLPQKLEELAEQLDNALTLKKKP